MIDVRFGSEADMCSARAHVRFTPKTDMCSALDDVCFVPIADMRISVSATSLLNRYTCVTDRDDVSMVGPAASAKNR